MIEISRHIEILLLSNDCVIVPGLGGFMAHHVEARYDERDSMFLPPLRTLGFNPQLTMNDSLLVQSYVEAYDLSYPEALRRIEDEVTELRQHLENEGCYEMPDIGMLTVNDEGRYVFTPCEAGILTPELYGLSSFEIARKAETTAAGASHQPAAAIATAAPTVETDTPAEDEAEQEEAERAIVIKMSWVRNAVAVAAAVIAFVLMTTPVTNSTTEPLADMGKSAPVVASILPNDTNVEKAEISLKDTLTTAISTPQETAEKAVEDIKEKIEENNVTDCYKIVLASYITKKNAAAYVEQLHQKGFAEAEVMVRNKVTRVVYGTYSTANQAYSMLNSVRNSKEFEEAWVMKVEANS